MHYRQASAYPLVSVIIPAYNAEMFIAQALYSVLHQTYQNLEVLVVDDGSGDGTSEIVQSIAWDDQRVMLLTQSNMGVAAARNLAIGKCKGEYIAPLDADDIWYPQALDKLLACLMRGGLSTGVAYAWSVYINENGQITGDYHASNIEGRVYTTLLTHNFLGNASASMIRRQCFEKVGGYDCGFRERKAQGCEDWDLYLRIAERYEFRVVSEFLVGYRKMLYSMTSDYAAMARSHGLLLQSARQKHPGLPGAIFCLSASSFYMYLAYESGRCGGHRFALRWMWRAIRVDPITPFLRYGLYWLTIQSILSLVVEPVSAWLCRGRCCGGLVSRPLQCNMTLADVRKRCISLRYRLLVQDVLQWVMQRAGKTFEAHRAGNLSHS